MMADYKTYDFVAGDILQYQGKTFQVHENLGVSGLVAEYPSSEAELAVVDWNDDYIKTGYQPLGDSPSGGCAAQASPPIPSDPQQPVPLRILDAPPPKKSS